MDSALRASPTSQSSMAGFTLVEIAIAVLLLGVGVGSLLGTAALNVREVGGARQATMATLGAEARMESLRAATSVSHCGGAAAGTDTTPEGTVLRWAVGGAGPLRDLSVIASYAVSGGRREDSLSSAVWCP